MNEQERKDWLERRKNGIGASDSPQILGLSLWGSAISVYNDKLSLSEEFEMSERMEIGLLIEDFIAKLFCKKTGKKVRNIKDEVYSKDIPYIYASLDRDIVGEKSVLECKNVQIFHGDKWDGTIPDMYNIQCHHQMYATGSEKAYLAALFSGCRFEIYEINRDQDVIDFMIPKLVSFWEDNVKKQILPIANHLDSQYLTESFFDHDEEFRTNHDISCELIDEYKNLSKIIDESKKRKEVITNQLKQQIGDSNGLVTERYQVSWSRWESERFDTKSFQQEHPKLFDKYKKSSKMGRISIKGELR